MPFSQDDTDRIRSDLRAALVSTSLTDWQRGFLGDMQTRFDRYGAKTRLTDKQYAKLKQILAPFERSVPAVASSGSTPRSKPAPERPRSAPRSPSRTRLSYRPPSPLRTIRKVRRTAREAMWVLAMIGGLFVVLGNAFNGGTSSSPERIVSTTSTAANSGIYGAGDFSITDGDTVQLYGARSGTRLVGFNTPETYKPRCDRELALGRQATARLKDLVRSADRVELRLVACACPPGTQGTRDCNYGRSCGVLTVDGQDVRSILIAEGLAARFQCGRTSCPPLPRPWCR